jgi:toxin ParE1/3/4
VQVRRRLSFVYDLAELHEYLADRNPAAADRLLERIERLTELLADNPELGRSRAGLGAGLRSFRVQGFPYLVFYRLEADEVALVRIVHGARRLRRGLFAE